MSHQFYRTVFGNKIPTHIATDCFYIDTYVLIYKPNYKPHFFAVYPGLKEVVEWCEDNLGLCSMAVVSVKDEWLVQHNVFAVAIADDEDAAAYKLAWD